MFPLDTFRRLYSHDHAPAEAERLAQRACAAYLLAEHDAAYDALARTAESFRADALRLAAKLSGKRP